MTSHSISRAINRSLLPIAIILLLLASLGLTGCSTHRSARDEEALASDSPSASEQIDYDPWESFNDKTFYFNFDLADHYAIKPAAKVWAKTFPQQVRQSLANAFYNLAMPKRFVNKVLQLRLPAAGIELTRFVLNTTVGVAGLFDVASRVGLEKSDADTGQTFAVYGAKPGPYLVLPLVAADGRARRFRLRRRLVHGPTLVVRHPYRRRLWARRRPTGLTNALTT